MTDWLEYGTLTGTHCNSNNRCRVELVAEDGKAAAFRAREKNKLQPKNIQWWCCDVRKRGDYIEREIQLCRKGIRKDKKVTGMEGCDQCGRESRLERDFK